jgi:predicted porin
LNTAHTNTATYRLVTLLACLSLVCASASASEEELAPVDTEDLQPAASVEEVIADGEANRLNDSTNENPDAGRIAKKQRNESTAETDQGEQGNWELDLYGSVRLHAINTFNIENENTSRKLGDGASRVGLSGSWSFTDNWDLFGRVESGFDILDSFTPKAQGRGDKNLRLANIGLESDQVYLKAGKSWSVYYTVAGAADRFAIFGGNAAGAYNANSDGGATGTGRTDDALQTMIYIDPKSWSRFEPFNLNLQYALGQPIPHVRGQDYDYSWGMSAWLENESHVGVGLAYHRAAVENLEATEIREAGIDGDATAASLALKTYGSNWLASLVLSRLNNIETTEQNQYFNGDGAELFAQWEFAKDFWFVTGGNWLLPDDDNERTGEYSIKYGVLGVHYSIDSSNRMLYVEWKDDHGKLSNGRKRKNEFTLGIRWDIGY